jgi:hypothetical protein
MFDSLKKGFDAVNARYGLNISIKKRYGDITQKAALDGGVDNADA